MTKGRETTAKEREWKDQDSLVRLEIIVFELCHTHTACKDSTKQGEQEKHNLQTGHVRQGKIKFYKFVDQSKVQQQAGSYNKSPGPKGTEAGRQNFKRQTRAKNKDRIITRRGKKKAGSLRHVWYDLA